MIKSIIFGISFGCVICWGLWAMPAAPGFWPSIGRTFLIALLVSAFVPTIAWALIFAQRWLTVPWCWAIAWLLAGLAANAAPDGLTWPEAMATGILALIGVEIERKVNFIANVYLHITKK